MQPGFHNEGLRESDFQLHPLQAAPTGGDPVEANPRLQQLRQAGHGAKEGLADFFSHWFGALRLHHKDEEELEAVKRRDLEEPAVLGKAERQRNFHVVKDPLKGRIREPPVSRTQVADYRNASERELKGLGWGGPPIKRPKRRENQEGLAEMIEEHVHEEDTEFFVMQSFPTFILSQSLLIFVSYVLLSLSSGQSLAGLETLFPGQTDLALTDVTSGACEDFRFQLWRGLTYQFTHSSFTHVLGNVLLVLMCGINLEGFHGSCRVFGMFELGVLGGAGCVCVFDSHARVVGMSGGAYALLGMQLGDVLMNWERKSAPYRLIFIFLLILVEVLLYLFNPQEEISYSAHTGGGVAGLLLALIFGRNLSLKTYELEVQVLRLSKLLFLGLATFCLCWALINWPPRNLLEQVPYCAARSVSNETLFGSGFHCVRCPDVACMARWSPPLQNDSLAVNPRACESWAE